MKTNSHLGQRTLLVAAFAVSLLLGPPLAAIAGRADDGSPRLVVLVVVDQLRGDYPLRWQHLYRGGLHRLQRDGAWFANCHYPYAGTTTAAGHASIVTGCLPCEHGFIANRWYDRLALNDKGGRGKARDSIVVDRPYRRSTPGVAKTEDDLLPLSPERLLAQTVADVLKDATGGQAKVVALSVKDRSAIISGGRRPDACYWCDPSTGLFITTDYYPRFEHAWVARFNHERPPEKHFGAVWERVRQGTVDYVAESGPDDVKGEGHPEIGLFATFPHVIDGGLRFEDGKFLDGKTGQPVKTGRKFYEALNTSPLGNERLLDLALEAIDAERLGTNATPDLLCLSFSANDLAGHAYGPDSQEVLDFTLRTDDLLGKLMERLDERVGKGGYVLVLTADHGVCPMPAVAQSGKGLYLTGGPTPGMTVQAPLAATALRVKPSELKTKAEAILNERFPEVNRDGQGKAAWILAEPDDFWLYLNRQMLREHDLDLNHVADVLAAGMKSLPYVLATYTRAEMAIPTPPADELRERLRRSFHPERSGDVAVVLQPYSYLWGSKSDTGTSHGSPFAYDTHVPLMVYGPGVAKGLRGEPVTPLAAAAMLARALRIPPPASAQAPLPPGLFTP